MRVFLKNTSFMASETSPEINRNQKNYKKMLNISDIKFEV